MRTALVLAIALASAAVFAQSERNFARRVAADPKGAVAVSNVSGSVAISTWDRAEVDVKAELGANVERVDVISEKGRTIVKVVPARGSNRDSDADLQVVIPRGSELSVTSVSADVTSRGVHGVQRLQTISGDIEADIGPANVAVKTVSGNAALTGTGKPGELRVSTVSGDVRVAKSAGRIEAMTVSGNMHLNAAPATTVRARSTSGNLTFEGNLARNASFEAETMSGNVHMQAGGEGGYEYEVSTFSGDIDNCFKQSAENSNGFGPGSRLDGKHGDGSARIRVKTMSGDVSLCDRRDQ